MISYGVVSPDVLKSVSGLEFLQGMVAGKFPQPPIAELIGFELAEIERGRATFLSRPQARHYNPIGSVHGGYAATLLDSCMGCAVQSELAAGFGYTTVEFKITFVRGMTSETGIVRAEGTTLNVGRKVGLAEGRLFGADGTLLAHATTTCVIFAP